MTKITNQNGAPTPSTAVTSTPEADRAAHNTTGLNPSSQAPPRGLTSIRSAFHEALPLGDRLAWLDQMTGGLIAGGAYLLAGAPGGGKSRIGTQIALELGARQIRSLVILTEEEPERLLGRARMMTGGWPADEAELAMRHVDCCDDMVDLDYLPTFFAHNVLSPRGRFAGVKLILIDSLQGDGLAATSTRKYARFYEFVHAAKNVGITVVAIGHVNKRGQLAGPKGLEHFVDAVFRVEKVADFRVFAVTKNRFGPERPRGIPLLIDPVSTELRPSPHVAPVTGSAKTFISAATEAAELQASVSLPMPGSRPQITAPGLPRRRIEQLVGAITGVSLLGLDQFDLNIGCLLPGDATFRSWLGLPLAMALIASCIRRPVPVEGVYVGEIDLNRHIRPLTEPVLEQLTMAIESGLFHPRTRLFLSPASAEFLPGDMINLVPCVTLDQAIASTWADLH